MREPPAGRLLQDQGRLHPHVAPLGCRERGRRRGRLGRQPRAGRRARGIHLGHPVEGLHAARGTDAQAARHAGLRGDRRAAGLDHRRVSGRGADLRRRDRRGAGAPVRPPRHRCGAGDVRPRDPRAVPRRAHRRRRARWRWPARRHQRGVAGVEARRQGDRCAGRDRRGLPVVARRGPSGVGAEDGDAG